jgi:hypothetical protein
MKMFNIRKATPLDVNSMLIPAKKFVEFYGIEWHLPSVSNLLSKLITDGVVFLAFKDEQLVGGIGGIELSNPWNNTQHLLQEMFWWVNEDQRGSSVGLRLLRAFEEEATSTVVLSILPQTPVKKEMLSKLGYNLKELSYFKEI